VEAEPVKAQEIEPPAPSSEAQSADKKPVFKTRAQRRAEAAAAAAAEKAATDAPASDKSE
jgi:hypothetical protein